MNMLETLALKLSKDPADRDAQFAFEKQLKQCVDPNELRMIAESYTPHTEVSIPICRRVLELVPDDRTATVALGWLYWLNGDDEEAHEQLDKAKSIDRGNTEVLIFEAALARDNGTKIRLYKTILENDPSNKVAQENLRQLSAAE